MGASSVSHVLHKPLGRNLAANPALPGLAIKQAAHGGELKPLRADVDETGNLLSRSSAGHFCAHQIDEPGIALEIDRYLRFRDASQLVRLSRGIAGKVKGAEPGICLS